jgi:hypothetical protein
MNGTNEQVSVSSFLSSAELPLPNFDKNSHKNPVYHLRGLGEFIQFRGVPKALQLAVSCRSMVGQMSKQWIAAVSQNLADYESFKEAFLRPWWSSPRQSLQKCRLYQAKYNRQSALSLSGHFLKYAMMASYLEPKPTSVEIIEAIRFYYPVGVQKAMLTNQLSTIEGTLVLLKRSEVIDAGEGFHRPPNPPQNQHPQIWQVQYQRPRNRNHHNQRRNNYHPDRSNESQGGGSDHLNPNNTTFQARQEQVHPTPTNHHGGN